MTNTEPNADVLREYFIWEEKSLTEHQTKSENNGASDHSVTTNDTKTMNEPENWKLITDPNLRKKMYHKVWYEMNKNKVLKRGKVWYELNKDKKKKYQKSYCEANRDKVKKTKKTWREANRDKTKTYDKAYQKANKDKKNEYFRNRNETDIQFKLSRNLRSRLQMAINHNQKTGSAVKDLGCSIDEFKSYLESKFQPGMTWDNYGYYGWHIDHIKPLAKFDLSDRKQLLEACHYTNLQPLWAKDNLAKSDR